MSFSPESSLKDFIRGTSKDRRKNESLPNANAIAMPPGTVIMGGWIDIPAGYIACNGAEYDRVGYADLFAAIGTQYGAGDGSTTFNVPGSNGRVPRGNTTAPGAIGGSSTHTHALSDNGQAQIGVYSSSSPALAGRRVGGGTWTQVQILTTTGASDSSATRAGGSALQGSTDSASNLQPFIDYTFAIKY